MRASLAILAMILFADSARCADADRKPLDEQFLRSHMAGEYDLIGRKPDSSATYNGRVTLRDEGGVLQVTRTVEGKIDTCAARFDTVQGAGNLILTITHDSRATFIFPAPNRPASKRFFQSISDRNKMRKGWF
jgi:hypothetical protein